MSLVEVSPPDSEVAWREGEERIARAMSAANVAFVELVDTMVDMLAREGWQGWGIESPVHWLCWKANVSRHRAEGIVQVARRVSELPACWALCQDGQVTEDAMVRIARRVPAADDAQVARVVTIKTISQLTRALSCLPELPAPGSPKPPERAEYFRRHIRPDGSEHGEYDLSPEHAAIWALALAEGRDAEFRDRNDLPEGAEVGDEARRVTWVDAGVRMAADALDVNDPALQRTGHPGERHQVVLHHDIDPAGRMGPGRLHLGGVLTGAAARWIACDAQVIVMAYRRGKLLGIKPAERTPNRRLRRYLEHRDGGCVHPVCSQKRRLHAHHLRHWEDGGPTEPANLVCLCPNHHRRLHAGDFTIEGNPEDCSLVFRDRHGRAIKPPELGADPLPPPADVTFTQPYGGRLSARDFTWN